VTTAQPAADRRFRVEGSRNGSLVHLTWNGGVLTGDPPTIDLLEVEAELLRQVPQDRRSWAALSDPEGLVGDRPLTDPDAVWHLIVRVLDTITSAEGDLPQAAVEYLAQPRVRRR